MGVAVVDCVAQYLTAIVAGNLQKTKEEVEEAEEEEEEEEEEEDDDNNCPET